MRGFRIGVVWGLLLWLVGGACAVGDEMQYDIPRLDGVTVDGAAADWGERGLRVEYLGFPDGSVRAPQKLEAEVRLAWDARGLLALVTVLDPTPQETAKDQYLFDQDSVEIFVANRRGEADSLQVVISPGVDAHFPEPRMHIYDHRRSPALVAVEPVVEMARERIPGGYQLEVRIPWTNLGITPAVGRDLAFQINVNDAYPAGVDAEGKPMIAKAQAMWFPTPGAFSDTRQMHVLCLAETASAPAQTFVTAGYVQLQQVVATVTGLDALVGKTVTVREGERILGMGTLVAESGRAKATLTLPMPARGTQYGPLAMLVGEQRVATVELPDPEPLRRQMFMESPITFATVLFEGTKLPTGDYADAETIRAVVGPYTITTTYYDAARRPVTTAEQPGRYGAVLQIAGPNGLSRTAYSTLFRLPEGWAPREGESSVTYLRRFGVELDALLKQDHYQTQGLRDMPVAQFVRAPKAAMLLAGIFESPDPAHLRYLHEVWVQDRTWWYAVKEARGEVKPDYMLTLPPGYDAARAERWPLVVFLHGSGGGEGTLASFVQGRQDFPCIILAPRSPREWWVPVTVKAAIDEVLAQYPIDRDRIYLTGLSMGGFGTWIVGAEYPDLFAALAPVCGGGDPLDAPKMKHLPVWAFHGAQDQSVPLELGQAMVDALKAAGDNDVRFTVYPDVGHDSWNNAYTNPELFRWLLAQRRGQLVQP